MKYIILMIIALFGASVHAPELKKSKKATHPAHDAIGVSNPLIKLTKGDGLKREIKKCKELIEEKKQTKKRSRWSTWRILLCTVCVLIGLSIVVIGTAALVINIAAHSVADLFGPFVLFAGETTRSFIAI